MVPKSYHFHSWWQAVPLASTSSIAHVMSHLSVPASFICPSLIPNPHYFAVSQILNCIPIPNLPHPTKFFPLSNLSLRLSQYSSICLSKNAQPLCYRPTLTQSPPPPFFSFPSPFLSHFLLLFPHPNPSVRPSWSYVRLMFVLPNWTSPLISHLFCIIFIPFPQTFI